MGLYNNNKGRKKNNNNYRIKMFIIQYNFMEGEKIPIFIVIHYYNYSNSLL